MFDIKSESGENRSQSAGETLQPLPNTRAATQESATGSDPQTQRIASDEARQFLQVLGKDPAAAWFRTIRPGKGANKRRKGADLHGFNADELAADSAAGDSLYVVIGNADTCTGKAISDADITSLPALFAEWDTGTAAEQQQALDASGLPEPSMLVHTGGKSLHAYWLLDEPISPEQWKLATRRLIAHTAADPQCSNPSRVMRLPGSTYYDKKTGKPTGTASIISAPGTRYALAALVEVLPAMSIAERNKANIISRHGRATTASKSPGNPVNPADFAPRSLDDIQAAAQYIPERVVGGNTYETCRRALCGCAAALDEIGLPEQQALDLLAAKWPSTEDAQQALNSSTTRNPAAFWAIAKEHGFNTRRKFKVLPGGAASGQAQQAAPDGAPSRFTPRADTAVRWGQRTLSHTRRMACFDRCVEVQAKQERNSLRRRARLLKALHDLKLQKYINRDEIAQRVLEAKDASQGNRFQALTAADRAAMERPVVRYLLPGILPASDASILGGLAKVGKTRLAVAMVAAVLTGQAMFDLPAPTTTKPVVLVTDDQADGDTADMLDALQLWEHPQLVWSRNFRLTEHDLDALLATIAANPGALVVIDSLRSISRNLRHGENDPEIGATLYDLKQAVIDAGGTLLLIHHCNKAQEQVGTEALSGHNAIAGAANTILTLHYLPGENGRPNKTAPERRLFREPRSGEGFDLVISRDGNGSFRKVCTLTQWQQQAQEAKEANKRERVSPMQQQVLEALQEAAPAWLTKRQVCEEIGVEWGDRGRGPEPLKVERALRRLVELGTVESERTGTAASYRSSCSGQNEVMTVMTPLTTSDASGSQRFGLSDDSDDSDDNQSGTDCQRCHHPSEKSDDTETPGGDSLSALSSLSSPAWLPQLRALRSAHPTATAYSLMNLLMGEHNIRVTLPAVKAALQHLAESD
jgi:Fe2+ or Zn2+ uptake regulation protein